MPGQPKAVETSVRVASRHKGAGGTSNLGWSHSESQNFLEKTSANVLDGESHH